MTAVCGGHYFPGHLPDEMKGNMLGRSTPSPERPPDGPLSPNGSIRSADTAPATLLQDPPPDGPTGAVESKEPDGDGVPAAGARHDQTASGTGPTEPEEKSKQGAEVRASLTAGVGAMLAHRGIRPTVLGVALAALAFAPGLSSALTVAFLVVGALMLIVGLMGPRLQGRFAIEFGPNGASLELQTHMAPAGRTRIAGSALVPWRPAGAPITPGDGDTRSSPAHDRTITLDLLNKIIEAGGKTIEPDAEQLRTLLTAHSPRPLEP